MVRPRTSSTLKSTIVPTRPQTEIRLATHESELTAILELQRVNVPSSISDEEAREQGFVTVVHSLPTLQAMHREMPSVVARQGDDLVGYALAMPESTRALIPVLEPMFALFERLHWRGRPLRDLHFYVMGQICVARGARGQGIFDALYAGHREHYGQRFELLVTEVATRNTRSMRAHERVGFEVMHRYRDETDEWNVIGWNFG